MVLLLGSPWSLASLDTGPDYRRGSDAGMVAGTDGLRNLGGVAAAL